MIALKSALADIRKKAKKVRTAASLAELKSEILGKKGVFAAAMAGLATLEPKERPKVGSVINGYRKDAIEILDGVAQKLAAQTELKAAKASAYDVTLPGRRQVKARPHPLRIVEQQIVAALTTLGFSVAEGPLAEHEWHNFEALNIPPDHPARDMQDTFFLAPRVVLRTHTSNVQVRTMLGREPPIRIVAPGMVFRHDEVDATHSPVFHQVEGLWVDDQASFADLKGVLRQLLLQLFGPQAKLRFRPSFFPFTEPSVEVDVSCSECQSTQAASCKICRGTGWLEVLGAGVVDPSVLRAVGYDPERVQGFAFGIGIERMALLMWGVEDIRLFYENDIRFLAPFAGGPAAVPRI